MNSFVCPEFRILLGLGAVAVEPKLLYQPAVFGTLSAYSCKDRKDMCQVWTGDWPLPPTPRGHLHTAGMPTDTARSPGTPSGRQLLGRASSSGSLPASHRYRQALN